MNEAHAAAVREIEDLILIYFYGLPTVETHSERIDRFCREAAQMPTSRDALSHFVNSLPTSDRWGISFEKYQGESWSLVPNDTRVTWLKNAYRVRDIPF